MDKKKKTYLLLVAVLGLWGTIGYKVISTLDPDESAIVAENIIVDFSPEKTKTDTFSIAPIERDPFLGKLTRKSAKTKKHQKRNIKKPDLENPWPQIQYQGMVKKQGANAQIFIVTINQQQYLLKKNQELNNIKLLKGNAKVIQVRFNKETKTFEVQ